MEQILNVAIDITDTIQLADTAEKRLIEEGRHLNREVLEVWAANKINKMATRFESKHKNARKDVKKLCWHSTVGKIHVEEQVYRIGARGNRFRPFSEAVGVSSHSYSHCLQRAICDFGSDNAFGVVNKKLKEHYGITVPASIPRIITEHHAQLITNKSDLSLLTAPAVEIVIGESDGSMIPIVESYIPEEVSCEKQADRRKNKRLFWKEARLSLAHAKGSITPVFAGTMESVEVAGQQLLSCAHRYVIQDRLKLAGSWWKIDHAKNMINLRTCRANDLWDDYWRNAA